MVGGRGTCYDVNNVSCLYCSATFQLVGSQALLVSGDIFFQVQKFPCVLVKLPEFSCWPVPLSSSSWVRIFNTVTSEVSKDQRMAEGSLQAGSESKPVKSLSGKKKRKRNEKAKEKNNYNFF